MPEGTEGLYHLRLVGQLHGQYTQNGYWFANAPDHTVLDHASNAFGIAERFSFNVMPYIKDFACTEWHYIGLICATMIPRFGPIVEIPFESGSGNQPNESIPSCVAAILSLRTGFGGRNRLGRSYYAGIGEVDQQDSRLMPDSLARLQSIGDALVDNFNHTNPAHLFHYGVYSPKLGDTPNPVLGESRIITMAGFTPITQTIARRILGTCRHRKVGHGA